MKLSGKKPWYVEYFLIIAGTALMALAIGSVFDSSELVTGGFSGAAIIIKKWTEDFVEGGIPLWVTNVGLNIPMFLLGWKIRGFHFVRKAIVGELMLSVWLAVLPVWNLAGDDLLLAAVYGGVILGTGIGMVFLGGGTTGGTDMLAAIIQKYLRHYSIAQVMQFVDGAIVILGMYVFGMHKAMYAIISVFLVTKVSDGLIEGLKFCKAAYIITEKPDEISEAVLRDIDRGITGIHAKGMFSGDEKMMLYCVVSKKEIIHLKELVDKIDPDAFVIVSDAREVHGRGFTAEK